MATLKFEIETDFPVSLRLTVESHGWIDLSPWRWDAGTGSLSRLERTAGGEAMRVEVSQSAPTLISVWAESNEETVSAPEVRDVVRRWLSLGWSPVGAIEAAERVDPEMADILRSGGGRMLRCSTFYEDLIKTVCTIQISWAGTRRMVDALAGVSGNGLFPLPADLLGMGEQGLRDDLKLGFRAPVVIEATRRLLDEGLMDEQGRGDEERLTYDVLIGLRGIGPYAAGYLAVLLHDFSKVPVDSAVTRYCRDSLGIEAEAIEGYFERWGDYRFLGYRLRRIAEAG